MAGSSPLARGLLAAEDSSDWTSGIIPARAGFTRRSRAVVSVLGDHPRSRGVYPQARPVLLPLIGSSPLARGLLCELMCVLACVRIIPARAGFTQHGPRGPGCPADHPRSRGVYHRMGIRAHGRGGSSPLARGLPIRANALSGDDGIIPARAGFTARVRGRSTGRADHPRSRGVYSTAASPRPGAPGSSPLARGLLDKPTFKKGQRGIIPARAGFTGRR